MNKTKVTPNQWVHHTSGVIGQVVWIDPDIHSNAIQVNWKHSAFGRPDRVIDANEVIPYIGPVTWMNKDTLREPELVAANDGNMLIAPYSAYLVSYPDAMSSPMQELLMLNDNDINLLATRFHYLINSDDHPLNSGAFVTRKAWVIHRVMLGILLFGLPTLSANVSRMTSTEALKEIIARYE